MKYTTKYFFKKFYNIPIDRWMVGSFGGQDYRVGAHCALGHCHYESTKYDTSERGELSTIFYRMGCDVPSINDYDNLNHCYNTPAQAKQAILCKLVEALIKKI